MAKKGKLDDLKDISKKVKTIKTKFILSLIGIACLLVIVIFAITLIGSNAEEVFLAYDRLGGSVNDSKDQFQFRNVIITYDEKGRPVIQILSGQNGQDGGVNGIGDSDPGTGEGGSGGGGGNGPQPPDDDVEIVPADDDVVIDGWLVLHKDPSDSGSVMTAPSGICYNNWSMGEGNNTFGSVYCKNVYSDKTQSRPKINGATASEGIVDSQGYYWVAIGPAWFGNLNIDSSGYPSPPHGGSITPSNVLGSSSGFTFDIVVNYQGKTYYVWAKLGDAKVHTFGKYTCKCGSGSCGLGYSQSGTYHTGSESLKYRDCSLVEWCGVTDVTGAGLSSKMEFVGIAR